MKVKFSKFERVAGLFVLTTVFGVAVSVVMVAIEKGWFERKISLQTSFSSADGLAPGTQVQMSGLRVGSIDSISMGKDNRVKVIFSVNESVFPKVKSDSVIRSFRPFIIGERALDLTPGGVEAKSVSRNAEIPSEESIDLMDLVSGKNLGPHIEALQESMENLKILFNAFQDKERLGTIVSMFDQLPPTLREVRLMAREVKILGRQATEKKRLKRTLNNLLVTTRHLNKVMPEVVEIVQNSPDLGKNTSQIVDNLAVLTTEMKVLIPTLTAIAPELPETSRKAIEAMSEVVIVLKAMQKSFMLRGAVADVKEEEEERRKKELEEKSNSERLPANE